MGTPQIISDSALFTVQNSSVIQSVPKLIVSSPIPLTQPLLNSASVPRTVTYLNFPLTTNGHMVPTVASLPRIAPKPIESLTAAPTPTIKTESGDDVLENPLPTKVTEKEG